MALLRDLPLLWPRSTLLLLELNGITVRRTALFGRLCKQLVRLERMQGGCSTFQDTVAFVCLASSTCKLWTILDFLPHSSAPIFTATSFQCFLWCNAFSCYKPAFLSSRWPIVFLALTSPSLFLLFVLEEIIWLRAILDLRQNSSARPSKHVPKRRRPLKEQSKTTEKSVAKSSESFPSLDRGKVAEDDLSHDQSRGCRPAHLAVLASRR